MGTREIAKDRFSCK